MAGELQFAYGVTAKSVYFQIRNQFGQIWNTVSAAFQTYQTANVTDYDIAATEQGTASGYYTASFPTAIPRGNYNILVLEKLSSNPSEGDLLIGVGEYLWTGIAVAPNGIPLLLHRLYGKVTLTSTQQKTFDTDNSAVLVTQSVSDDGSTQTQNAGA